jgi:hypothetical protein
MCTGCFLGNKFLILDFYYMHFISVRYNDPIPAAGAVIIDYITLPLRGNPIHIVCDIPADRQHFRHYLPHVLI